MVTITWRGETVGVHGGLPIVGNVAPKFLTCGKRLIRRQP